MASPRKTGAVAAVAAAALFVAACGGSTGGSSSSSAPASSLSATATVKTAKGPVGTYLTDASGRALYLWLADRDGKSHCAAACAKFWPPATTKSAPKAAGGVAAENLGTITRSGGAKEITYKGHPLYYYVQDTGPNMVKGQGSNTFGARWWLVAPSGSAITKSVSSSGGGAYGSGGY
jgi:predicted lipoprotein with Yx(FWY)xxD motif